MNYDWGMFRAVDDDDENVYLLNDNGVGIPIPKRAFSSQEDVERFIATVGPKVIARA